MREAEQRGAEADSSPEVAEHAHELRLPRGNFTAGGNVPPVSGDGAAPVASDGTAPKPTASEQAYGDTNSALDTAFSKLMNERSDSNVRDNEAEIADLVKQLKAEVAKNEAIANKLATLLPTIIAAVGANDETVLVPIKSELEKLGVYPAVAAAVAPTKHRTEPKLDHRPHSA